MDVMQELLKMSKGNKIYIEDILDFDLSEKEYNDILKKLNDLNIDIISKQEYYNNSIKGSLLPFKKYKKLTKEEEYELFERYKKGDKVSKEIIVNQNLNFIVKIAKTYSFILKKSNIDLEDLIQQGIIGVLEAMERFDTTKGFRFITYSYYWIKKNIYDYLCSNSKSLKLHPSYFSDIIRIEKYTQDYIMKNQKLPTKLEISKALNLDTKKIDNLFIFTSNTIYLYDYIKNTEDEESLIFNFIKDGLSSNENEYENINDKIDLEYFLMEIKNILTPREYNVICSRYGFNKTNDIQTLNYIAKQYKITTEYIRIIEKRALTKIKSHLINKIDNKKCKSKSSYYKKYMV